MRLSIALLFSCLLFFFFRFFYNDFAVSVEDNLSWALFCAFAAIRALGVIDSRKVVNNAYRAELASLFAELAADTTNVAGFSHVCALLCGRALDPHVSLCGNKLDDVLGTESHAGSASAALSGVYMSYLVDYGNGIEHASRRAGSKPETSAGAELVTAGGI